MRYEMRERLAIDEIQICVDIQKDILARYESYEREMRERYQRVVRYQRDIHKMDKKGQMRGEMTMRSEICEGDAKEMRGR